MLWVCGHYKNFNSFSAVLIRQNLTSTDVRSWRIKTVPALKWSRSRHDWVWWMMHEVDYKVYTAWLAATECSCQSLFLRPSQVVTTWPSDPEASTIKGQVTGKPLSPKCHFNFQRYNYTECEFQRYYFAWCELQRYHYAYCEFQRYQYAWCEFQRYHYDNFEFQRYHYA